MGNACYVFLNDYAFINLFDLSDPAFKNLKLEKNDYFKILEKRVYIAKYSLNKGYTEIETNKTINLPDKSPVVMILPQTIDTLDRFDPNYFDNVNFLKDTNYTNNAFYNGFKSKAIKKLKSENTRTFSTPSSTLSNVNSTLSTTLSTITSNVNSIFSPPSNPFLPPSPPPNSSPISSNSSTSSTTSNPFLPPSPPPNSSPISSNSSTSSNSLPTSNSNNDVPPSNSPNNDVPSNDVPPSNSTNNDVLNIFLIILSIVSGFSFFLYLKKLSPPKKTRKEYLTIAIILILSAGILVISLYYNTMIFPTKSSFANPESDLNIIINFINQIYLI